MGKSYGELKEELGELIPPLVNEIRLTLEEQGYSEHFPKGDDPKDKIYVIGENGGAINWRDENFNSLETTVGLVVYLRNPNAEAINSLKDALWSKGIVIYGDRIIADAITRIVWDIEVATS